MSAVSAEDSAITRRFEEMEAYAGIAGYARRLMRNGLGVVRDRALTRGGTACSDALAYVWAGEAVNVFQFLDAFSGARSHGHAYAAALGSAIDAMDLTKISGLGANMDALAPLVEMRDSWFAGGAGQTGRKTVERICMADAQFAVLALKNHLRHIGCDDTGFLLAIDAVTTELGAAAVAERDPATLARDRPAAPEARAVQTAMDWAKAQGAQALMLENALSYSLQTGHACGRNVADTFKTNAFYIDLCQSFHAACAESLERGTYVHRFAAAMLSTGRAQADTNTALYQYLKDMTEDYIDAFHAAESEGGEGPFTAAEAPIFAQASGAMMREFAKFFPLPPQA